MSEEEGKWIVAPCKGDCGTEIEDAGPVTDDNWWCTSCWPRENVRRLEAEVMRLRWALEMYGSHGSHELPAAQGKTWIEWDRGSVARFVLGKS